MKEPNKERKIDTPTKSAQPDCERRKARSNVEKSR